MQAQRVPGQQAPVKIYNAVYSSVQVYECMVRGIAVMRRRADSYVNATQILKVAGVDKGRRTKILEKEILPGKHEIVQGGYGKYQGTWIPLERGRDIAIQYGVAPLLMPLFDFVPNANHSTLGNLPSGMPNLSAGLAPPPIMPGSALRLLNQGRAQGLFTPSTSSLPSIPQTRSGGYQSPVPGPYHHGAYSQSPFHHTPGVSPTPPPMHTSLKRSRSEMDVDSVVSAPLTLAASPDIQTSDRSRPPSTAPPTADGTGPSPTKRARTEPSPLQYDTNDGGSNHPSTSRQTPQPEHQVNASPFAAPASSISRPPSIQPQLSSSHVHLNGNGANNSSSLPDTSSPLNARFASKPSILPTTDVSAPGRDTRRAGVIAAIGAQDDPGPVLDLLRSITPDIRVLEQDVDLVLDDQGHTALHIAASLARHNIVEGLLANGADPHRGNYNGETPLMRACLATYNADQMNFNVLVTALNMSIRTLDTARKTVLHHIVASAGVKGRAPAARYYLDQIFFWIAQKQGGDFRSIVDLQDEHGDTALNIAARVGNRSLVRSLLDVGANRILPNKLGLRPGDFGVETEELGGGPRAEDLLSSLRSGPSVPVLKSQDIIADMTGIISGLNSDFVVEVKAKQEMLDVTQAHLRAATRELSEQRKQIQSWQARCSELDQVTQRIRNVRKALVEEVNFDWTGRSGAGADTISEQASSLGSVDLSFNLDAEPPIPMSDTAASLIRLKRLKLWHERIEMLMDIKLESLRGASAEKEYQCKKVVSLCTGVPVDKVEEMLENLLIAVESESQVIDIGRVSGFMQKVSAQ